MPKVDIYLNFNGNTEEAFNFYKQVFQVDFDEDIMRISDMPAEPGSPEPSEEDKQKIMHIGLPIAPHTTLRGTDIIEAWGQKLTQGNHFYVHFQPNTREEVDRIFKALSQDGEVEMPLEDQFWGDYFGSLKDKFGIQWMVSCPTKQERE